MQWQERSQAGHHCPSDPLATNKRPSQVLRTQILGTWGWAEEHRELGGSVALGGVGCCDWVVLTGYSQPKQRAPLCPWDTLGNHTRANNDSQVQSTCHVCGSGLPTWTQSVLTLHKQIPLFLLGKQGRIHTHLNSSSILSLLVSTLCVSSGACWLRLECVMDRKLRHETTYRRVCVNLPCPLRSSFVLFPPPCFRPE